MLFSPYALGPEHVLALELVAGRCIKPLRVIALVQCRNQKERLAVEEVLSVTPRRRRTNGDLAETKVRCHAVDFPPLRVHQPQIEIVEVWRIRRPSRRPRHAKRNRGRAVRSDLGGAVGHRVPSVAVRIGAIRISADASASMRRPAAGPSARTSRATVPVSGSARTVQSRVYALPTASSQTVCQIPLTRE